MSQLWRKLDEWRGLPAYIRPEDHVFYAREYVSHGGSEVCDGNRLIHDFKKPVCRRGEPDWPAKEAAIRQFASELALLVDDGAVVVAVPSSKSRSDPEFDSRLEDTLAELKRLRPGLFIEEPIAARNSLVAAHAGGTRKFAHIYANYDWLGFTRSTDLLILVDDVLTTGCHFAACKRLIQEHHPDTRVMGVFWTKTVDQPTGP